MGPYKEIIVKGFRGFRFSIPVINKTFVNRISIYIYIYIYEESPGLRTTLNPPYHFTDLEAIPKQPDAALLPTAHEPPSSHTKP